MRTVGGGGGGGEGRRRYCVGHTYHGACLTFHNGTSTTHCVVSLTKVKILMVNECYHCIRGL